MQTIWKFPLIVADTVETGMPAGSKILTVQTQQGVVCLWAIVNPASPIETRRFRVVGTGYKHETALSALEYIGTAQTMGGGLVWHVFEMP